MSESYSPFSTGAGNSMTDAQWQGLITMIFPDGIAKNFSGVDCQVTAPNSNMTVVEGAGTGIIRGVYYNNNSNNTLTISTADPTNPRIDLVVIHADLSAKTIAAKVVTGTPAPSPSAPALTQTSTVWEIPLAQIAVAAGATSLSNSNVTDTRQYGGFYQRLLPAAAAGAVIYVQNATPTGSPATYSVWIKSPF